MPEIEYFPYLGPNRRSDKTVVEITLVFAPADQNGFPQHGSEIRDLLVSGGVLDADETFPGQTLPDEKMAWYASLLAQTALLLQRKGGHRVNFFSVKVDPEQNRCVVLLEHEHCDVGMTAVKLANELVSGQRKLLTEPFDMFKAFAHDRRLPLDTEAIIKAARRRDIPFTHLERFPLLRNNKADCIRLNGLIMLGHGERQHVLDGTFCLDKSRDYKGLLKSSAQRQALLENLGVCIIRSSEAGGEGAGKHHVIAVNGQLLPSTGQVHPSVTDAVLKINQAVGLAPIVVTLLTADISWPLTEGVSGVVDFELAPNLEHFHVPGSGLIEAAAEATVDWLFPDKTSTRMPIIAITGTNGKTTTSRMINHILMASGRKPGMVCTDGIFLNGCQVDDGDNSTMKGHFNVLASREVDFAVLETHHYGILVRGFAFTWCDIAVCLNVTEDHLGVVNVDTVEQMAEAKGSLLERARHAAVLNADDPNCLGMLDSITAETACLVSMRADQKQLSALVGNRTAVYCVLEVVEGEEWLVIYAGGERVPVIPSARIPATFDATARFNVSNAMHAIAATYLAGISRDAIRKAMACFSSGYESTPGRLNVFDDLPFRVIMDFAHNPDGFEKLCDFVDQQTVSGRKLIAFAGSPDRKDETLVRMGRAMADHFDFYFCKEHKSRGDVERRKVAPLLQQGLLEAGVDRDQTAIMAHGKEVIFEIFDSCESGDLLVMLLGHIEKHELAGQIREYAAQ